MHDPSYIHFSIGRSTCTVLSLQGSGGFWALKIARIGLSSCPVNKHLPYTVLAALRFAHARR